MKLTSPQFLLSLYPHRGYSDFLGFHQIKIFLFKLCYVISSILLNEEVLAKFLTRFNGSNEVKRTACLNTLFST